MKNLETLNKNLAGTGWADARHENGKLVADYHGSIRFAIGGGRYNCYEGITKCEIYPSKALLETVADYGFDQGGYVEKEMDYKPL